MSIGNSGVLLTSSQPLPTQHDLLNFKASAEPVTKNSEILKASFVFFMSLICEHPTRVSSVLTKSICS
jgi:hypothetical protein